MSTPPDTDPTLQSFVVTSPAGEMLSRVFVLLWVPLCWRVRGRTGEWQARWAT